jgi:hypothetical protein
MTTVDQFLDALAQVESSNNDREWGDGGRAMGRWQVHPDRLWSEARKAHLEPQLGETWDQFVGRVVGAMYNFFATRWAPREIAMYWHVGHFVRDGHPDWDLAYAQKFDDAMARALGQAIT